MVLKFSYFFFQNQINFLNTTRCEAESVEGIQKTVKWMHGGGFKCENVAGFAMRTDEVAQT